MRVPAYGRRGRAEVYGSHRLKDHAIAAKRPDTVRYCYTSHQPVTHRIQLGSCPVVADGSKLKVEDYHPGMTAYRPLQFGLTDAWNGDEWHMVSLIDTPKGGWKALFLHAGGLACAIPQPARCRHAGSPTDDEDPVQRTGSSLYVLALGRD
jgi:hypothetical protein